MCSLGSHCKATFTQLHDALEESQDTLATGRCITDSAPPNRYSISLVSLNDHIQSDNGLEFIESGLRCRHAEKRIKTIYVEPGSPWSCRCGRYVESFKACFREECLDREQLWTLTEARLAIEYWRWKYNNIRPHRSLGYITPLDFAQELPEETEPYRCWASNWPTASLRPDIDKLYQITMSSICPD